MERTHDVSHQPVPVLKNIRPGVASDDIKQTQHLFRWQPAQFRQCGRDWGERQQEQS